MNLDEYARLKRLIVISWTISLILVMIILYFGSKEMSNVRNAVNIQGSSLNENSFKVDELIERVNKINSEEFKAYLKGEKGDRGDSGSDGVKGEDGVDSTSTNTIVEKQSIKQIPVKGDKGEKGDRGEKGEPARQVELCKLTGPLFQTLKINIGWKYVDSDACFGIDGEE